MNNKLCKKRRGSVLIFTLFLLSFLSVIALSSAHAMRQGITLTQRYIENTKSFYIAKGVIATVVGEMKEDKENNQSDDFGEEWLANYAKNDEPVLQTFTDYDGKIIGEFRVSVSDENGKLNVNTVDAAVLIKFLRQFKGINNDQVARNIIAYRNSRATMKKIYSIHELLKINGMKKDLFLGEDTNENGILDPWENDGDKSMPNDNKDGKLDLGIKDYLTVYTEGLVNVNTASLLVLASMPGMTEDLAGVIIDFRDDNPFGGLEDLKDVPEVSDELFKQISSWAAVGSDWFKIAVTSKGINMKSEYHIVSVIDRVEDISKVRYWRED